MGHFNRPRARFTRKRFYVCDFGATKDAMSGEQNVDARVAAPGNSSMVSPRCLSFAAILLAAPTIRDRHVP